MTMSVHREQRIRFRPLGYMSPPQIRILLAAGIVHPRELQLCIELRANSPNRPNRVLKTSRYFIPMAGATHSLHQYYMLRESSSLNSISDVTTPRNPSTGPEQVLGS